MTFVMPYRRLRINAIASYFGVTDPEAEELAVTAIRDGRLGAFARVDQCEKVIRACSIEA